MGYGTTVTIGSGQFAMRALALAGFAALSALPVAAQAPTLAMLDMLERGQWQFTSRDGGPARAICLGDARALVQLRHDRPGCTRHIVEDTPSSVTVSYACGAEGYGRTTIRRETNRLVQVETQGVVRGAPFSDSYEGRRIGPCR